MLVPFRHGPLYVSLHAVFLSSSTSGTLEPPVWGGVTWRKSCSCSVAQLCLPICDPMDCSTPGFPVLQHLPKFAKLMSIELVMPSNHLILCHPLLFLPSTFPSIRVSSNESAVPTRWPKHWSFSFSPYNEYSRLTSFSLISLISLISLLSKGLSRIFSSTTVRRHQFFGTRPFLLSSFYICIWLQKASLQTKLVEVR